MHHLPSAAGASGFSNSPSTFHSQVANSLESFSPRNACVFGHSDQCNNVEHARLCIEETMEEAWKILAHGSGMVVQVEKTSQASAYQKLG
jgi:hypothetical protein